MVHWFSNCVEEAFRQTKSLLWPFQAKIWISLFVLNLLTGGFGGCSGVSIPSSTSKENDKPAVSAPAPATTVEEPVTTKTTIEQAFRKFRDRMAFIYQENKKTIFALIFILVAMGLLIFVLLMWLVSRLKMVLIQCLLTKTFHWREQWKHTRGRGQSLFRVNLAAFLLWSFPLIISGVLVGAGFIRHMLVLKDDWILLLVAGLVALAYSVAYGLAMLVINQFLPIYMSVNNLGARDAFRHSKSLRRNEILKALGALGLYLLLAIGVGIALSIALVIVILALAILFGIGSLAGLLLVKFLGVTKWALVPIGIILATPFVIILALLAIVPAETFKNYVAIEMMKSVRKST